MTYWRPYVPVAQRRAEAARKIKGLLKKGQDPQPVAIEGSAIATSFWGKAWCLHLESFSDYSNRLPRGRTYVRNGSIVHMEISSGRIEALVAGSTLYTVSITIAPLSKARWKSIVKKAAGGMGSMIELLHGEFSHEIMEIVTHPTDGLFPKPREIKLKCSCPDWAEMCKHLAAALYGIGNLLDTRPGLLFLLRGVDPQELISTNIALPSPSGGANVIPDNALARLFGITLDLKAPKASPSTKSPPTSPPGKTATTARTHETPRAVTTFTGLFIVRLRKRLKMSQGEFAAAAGVSTASVKRWESEIGKLRLQSATREALQALMDVKAK